MLRVLHIATSQNSGGVERYSVQMAAETARLGAWTRFACLPGAIVERQCAASGVGTLPLRVRNSGDGRAVRQIAEHIRACEAEIVHVHSRRDYLPALLGVALARKQMSKGRGGLPPRLVLHAHMVRPLGTPLALSGRVFGRGAAGVVAVSEAARDGLQNAHHFAPGFVRVLHNGVDLERFCPPLSPTAASWRARLRRDWGMDDNDLVMVMVGRLDAKGQAQMLSVLPVLAAHAPDVRLVLVGSEGIPGSRDALQRLARAGGVYERVTFTGPREDIPQVLAAGDLLAHLPVDEAFGLALVEAMVAGLPTVASAVGGCREIVQNGSTGILVPPGDTNALRAALQSLLCGPEATARRAEMGAAGRARATQEFSLARQAGRLLEIYRQLCLPSPSRPLPPHSLSSHSRPSPFCCIMRWKMRRAPLPTSIFM